MIDSFDTLLHDDNLCSSSIPSTINVLHNSATGIRVVHHNVQGLHSKIYELSSWFNTCSGDDVVFCFSEIWANPSSPPLHFPGYQVMFSPFHCRPDAKHLSYLPASCIWREMHSATAVEDSCKLLNVACCLVLCKHHLLAIVSVYRSPSTSNSDCLQEIRNMFSQLCFTSHVVVVGDFNFDLLSTSSVLSEYSDIISDFQFVQHVPDPFRVTSSSATLIDHMLTTPNITVLQCYQTVGLSDHRTQILEIDVPVIRPISHTLTVRSFRHCPWNKVREHLHAVPWQVMDIFDSVDDMWSFINSILCECLDMFAPLHSVVCKRSRHPTPWLTPSLLSAIKQKKQAKRKAEQSNDDADIQLYKRLKNQLKHLVNEAKISYVRCMILKTRKNPRSAGHLWCGVNNIIGRYKLRDSVLDTALSLDTVNDFFRSIAVTDDHKPASTFVPLGLGYNDSSFRFSTVSSSSVYSMLCALDEKKAVGPDGLSARFLKEIAEEITVPLTKLFNKSLEIGAFPSDWKHCNVTPVHKSGPKDNPSNFRPISVVPVAAKMLEKIVAQQLSLYLESNQALSPY